MRRLIALSAMLCLLLCGCERLYPREYLQLSEHNSPYAYKVDPTEPTGENPTVRTPVVSDYYALRSVLSGYVMTGVQHGQVRMEKYRGDEEQDVIRVNEYLTREDPLCAYAIISIHLDHRPTENGWLVSFDASYRRTVHELESIEFVRGNEAAAVILQDALNEFRTRSTVRISGYTEEDFVRSLRDYCMHNPNRVGMIPQINASIYPDQGNARVVEVRYSYPADVETLRTMRSETDSVLASAFNYIRFTENDAEKLRLIFSYIFNRFPYQADEENATFYSLLCTGVGSSVSYASVVDYLCRNCGMESYIVSGRKDGESWTWNILCLDGRYYHFDFHTASLLGEEPAPRTDEQMEGYEWDTSLYPACTDEAEQSE